MDEEMSMAQAQYIMRLLDERRVSRACAERIILMLDEQPPLNLTGLEILIQIQRPS